MAKKTSGKENQKPITKVQKNLRPYQKLFSQFAHNRFIDQLSDILEKTLARPSGLLGGSFAFLLSSVIVLIICNYYGYQYNYFIGLICFPLGFVLGILIELSYSLFKHK